jgi:hypothetical protein
MHVPPHLHKKLPFHSDVLHLPGLGWSHADGAIADVARPQNHFGDIQSSGSDLSKPEKSAKPAATDACIWDYLFMI